MQNEKLFTLLDLLGHELYSRGHLDLVDVVSDIEDEAFGPLGLRSRQTANGHSIECENRECVFNDFGECTCDHVQLIRSYTGDLVCNSFWTDADLRSRVEFGKMLTRKVQD